MNARLGKLALDYCLDNAPASDAGIARAYVESLESERDALKAALEASRADAERLAAAMLALDVEVSELSAQTPAMSEAVGLVRDAEHFHRALAECAK